LAEPESVITAKKAKKPTAKKPAGKLTPAENKLFDQMSSDIKAEGKASPKKLKSLTQQVATDQFKEDSLTGMGHPDAQALIKAGVPQSRVQQLTQAYAPSHPANAGTGITANPTDPSQYAADVLLEAGLPDTASNEKLLDTQMTEEGMPGSEDNPLATSLAMPGSKSVNSDGVQEYPNLAEGAQAEAATLGGGDETSLYDALKSGTATDQQYATALENSNYEGLGGSTNPANVAYGQSFLTDAGQPTTSFGTGTVATDPTLGTQALQQAMGTNTFAGLSSAIPQLGTSSANSSLQSALAGLSSSPEQGALTANTSDAPGSPDQTPSQAQQTNVNPAATYQAQLQALLGGKLMAGSAGKTNG